MVGRACWPQFGPRNACRPLLLTYDTRKCGAKRREISWEEVFFFRHWRSELHCQAVHSVNPGQDRRRPTRNRRLIPTIPIPMISRRRGSRGGRPTPWLHSPIRLNLLRRLHRRWLGSPIRSTPPRRSRPVRQRWPRNPIYPHQTQSIVSRATATSSDKESPVSRGGSPLKLSFQRWYDRLGTASAAGIDLRHRPPRTTLLSEVILGSWSLFDNWLRVGSASRTSVHTGLRASLLTGQLQTPLILPPSLGLSRLAKSTQSYRLQSR